MLQNKYGDKFGEVEMTLRKSLYGDNVPDHIAKAYNVYVEWDITAHFNCDKDKLPSRRELCGILVSANLEKYILGYLRGLPKDCCFSQTTTVFSEHLEC